MIRDDCGSEELLMGIGTLLAAAILLLIVFSLFRSTLPADRAVVLQSCTSEIGGDIATVAAASVPYSRAEQYSLEGISVSISSDFVTAEDPSGARFAKPLPVRVHPGRYTCGSVSWNGTDEFRECLNFTFGGEGTVHSPVDARNVTGITDLLAAARLDMAGNPVDVDPARPLVVEKLLIYVRPDSGQTKECIPCVFVYQR